MSLTTRYQKSAQNGKKKPPPRPPPPKFSNYRSKSTFNLNQNNQSVNLIEFNSPPSSPKTDRVHHHFGGSISSSFSSSTSSLASSKKSFELDTPVLNNLWPIQTQPLGNGFGNSLWPVLDQHNPHSNNTSHTLSQPNGATFQSYLLPSPTTSKKTGPPLFGPTIIRPQNTKKPFKGTNESSSNLLNKSPSPPMPTIPPPSPPKVEDDDVEPPYGIALYDFEATQPSDLALQENDVVILIRRINQEWLYGKVLDREGIFPENFIQIKVPLKDEEDIVTALYDFQPQVAGDLALKTGQKLKVTHKVSDEWFYGQTDLGEGQFPVNYVNRVPKRFR